MAKLRKGSRGEPKNHMRRRTTKSIIFQNRELNSHFLKELVRLVGSGIEPQEASRAAIESTKKHAKERNIPWKLARKGRAG